MATIAEQSGSLAWPMPSPAINRVFNESADAEDFLQHQFAEQDISPPSERLGMRNYFDAQAFQHRALQATERYQPTSSEEHKNVIAMYGSHLIARTLFSMYDNPRMPFMRLFTQGHDALGRPFIADGLNIYDARDSNTLTHSFLRLHDSRYNRFVPTTAAYNPQDLATIRMGFRDILGHVRFGVSLQTGETILRAITSEPDDLDQ